MNRTTHVEKKTRNLQWVPLGKIKVSPVAQRPRNDNWVEELFNAFDPDLMGTPEVNERDDGFCYVMDGQHRIAVVKRWLGQGWENQCVQCWVTKELSEQEEAETYLTLNKQRNSNALNEFKIALVAQRPVELEIEAQLKDLNLCISRQAVEGAISCVGAVKRVHKKAGVEVLRKSLRMTRDAYGDPGLISPVISGMGLICQRYNGAVDEDILVKALSTVKGGIGALLGRAHQIKQKTGSPLAHSVAAGIVEICNRRRGGRKLPSWWKTTEN